MWTDKTMMIYGQPTVDADTAMLRRAYESMCRPGWVAITNRDALAAIERELRRRCRHCGEKEEAHVGAEKKCLFDATTFERGARV